MVYSDIKNICALCYQVHVIIKIDFDLWKRDHGTSILVFCLIDEITTVQITVSVRHLSVASNIGPN